MSTTVTYKGQELTTIENTTKKLETAGTWLEDDITITDESSGGSVLVVDTPDEHGGTIREITATNVVALQGQKRVTPSGTEQTVYPDQGYDGFESVVVVAAGREDLTEPKDVDLIDYDGRLLYSYTVQEFLALSELPANPTNTGLIAQGWNWTLTDAQNFVGKYGALVIGQNYTTDNGRTKIYITMPQSNVDLNLSFVLCFYLRASSSATVYWGDGTSDTYSTTTFAAAKTATHYYSQSGHFVIEIDVTTGQMDIGYYGANHGIVSNDYRMRTMVDKIEVGKNVPKLARQPFACLTNMVSVSLPITLTEVDTSMDLYQFADCTSLKAVVFPSGFVGREQRWFTDNARALLKYLSFPKSMTKFQMGSSYKNLRKFTMYFYDIPADQTKWYLHLYDVQNLTHFVVPTDCKVISTDTCRESLLQKLVISDTVTSIASTAFAYNRYLKEIHMLPTTPPTLSNTNAFASLPSTCVIYVPYSEDHSILEAYQTATNWSTYASRMQEEPQS